MPTEESAPAPARPAPAGGRRRLIARVLLAALLLPAAGHYVYTRWTARPASNGMSSSDLLRLAGRPPQPDDASAELRAAIDTLPQLPKVPAPPAPPDGFVWVELNGPTATQILRSGLLLEGEWEPESRWLLTNAVAYLQQPACSQALDQVVALSARPFSYSLEQIAHGRIDEVANCLVGRARLRIHEGDWPGACRDLEACLDLAAGLAANSTLFHLRFAMSMRGLVVDEIGLLACEFELSPEQAHRLAQILRDHPSRLRQAWRHALSGDLEANLLQLDQHYTGQRGQDGFYVLSSDSNALGVSPPEVANLFSPLYDSRLQVEAYGQRIHVWAEQQISGADPRWQSSPLTLPPFAREWGADYPRASALCWTSRALEDSAAMMIAINVWAQEHGSYPRTPDELPQAWRSLWSDQEKIPSSYAQLRYNPETGVCDVVNGEGTFRILREEPRAEVFLVEAQRAPGPQ